MNKDVFLVEEDGAHHEEDDDGHHEQYDRYLDLSPTNHQNTEMWQIFIGTKYSGAELQIRVWLVPDPTPKETRTNCP